MRCHNTPRACVDTLNSIIQPSAEGQTTLLHRDIQSCSAASRLPRALTGPPHRSVRPTLETQPVASAVPWVRRVRICSSIRRGTFRPHHHPTAMDQSQLCRLDPRKPGPVSDPVRTAALGLLQTLGEVLQPRKPQSVPAPPYCPVPVWIEGVACRAEGICGYVGSSASAQAAPS